MYKQIKLQTPTVPNFILTEDLKQPIAIADFTEDELRQIGTEWTQELIRKARVRRGSPQIFNKEDIEEEK